MAMESKEMTKMIILFILYVSLSAGGLILFKMGSTDLLLQVNAQRLVVDSSWLLILGMVSYITSFILWLVIVTQGQLSLVMPLSVGVVNIMVLLGAQFLLKEDVTLLKWIGCLVIIAGLFIVGFGDKIKGV